MGIIVGRAVLIDPQHVDLAAVVSVAVADHLPAPREAFAAGVAALPEAIEVWRIAGRADVSSGSPYATSRRVRVMPSTTA